MYASLRLFVRNRTLTLTVTLILAMCIGTNTRGNLAIRSRRSRCAPRIGPEQPAPRNFNELLAASP